MYLLRRSAVDCLLLGDIKMKQEKTKALLLIIASGICAVLIAVGIAFAINGIRQVSCKHVWDEGVIVAEPTCYEEGELKFTCDKCDKTQSEAIDMISHTWEVVPKKEPTCTEAGHHIYTICTVCDAYKENAKPEVIAPLGHDEIILEGYAAECTKRGLTEGKYCERCEKHTVKQEILPALGHKIIDVAGVAPTCETSGVEQGQKCERCETVYWGCAELPALGHNIAYVGDIAPTCTEIGYMEAEACTRCGEIEGWEEIMLPLRHNLDERICVTCGADLNRISLYDLKNRYNLYGYKLVLAENITEEEVYSFLRTAGDTGGYYVWGANGADTDMLSIEIDRGELTIYIYDEMVFHIQESENDFSYTEIILNDELGFTSYIVDEINNELGIEDRQRFLSFFEFVYVGE